MSVGKLRQIGISIALGSCLALGCGREKSEQPAGEKSEQPAAGAAAPEPVVNPVNSADTLPNLDTMPTVELPGTFPQDVARYPGARVVKATAATEGERGWVAEFITPDEPAKVYANLADNFAAQGWSTERVDQPDGIMLSANKGDRSATYILLSAQGKTMASLILVE